MVKLLCRLLVQALQNRMRGNLPTPSLISASQAFAMEWQIYRNNVLGNAQLAAAMAGRQGICLNLGCGPNVKPEWVNLDLVTGADFTLDLREPLPLPNSSCHFIYSEHFFEHIDYPDLASKLLNDYFRLLEPGGRVSVGVPDGELALRAYAGIDPERFFAISKKRWHPDWAETRMEQINYLFRQGREHRFTYDEETLGKALTRAGFSKVHRRGFDVAIDSPEREWGTLYMDGYR